MDALQNFLLYFAMIQTVVWLTRITSSFSQSNCYAPKETICKRYLPFIENGDLANDVLFIKPSPFSLDKAESSPPSVHYYITNLLPTYCRNSKNPAHFYLCGILLPILLSSSQTHFTISPRTASISSKSGMEFSPNSSFMRSVANFLTSSGNCISTYCVASSLRQKQCKKLLKMWYQCF